MVSKRNTCFFVHKAPSARNGDGCSFCVTHIKGIASKYSKFYVMSADSRHNYNLIIKCSD